MNNDNGKFQKSGDPNASRVPLGSSRFLSLLGFNDVFSSKICTQYICSVERVGTKSKVHVS